MLPDKSIELSESLQNFEGSQTDLVESAEKESLYDLENEAYLLRGKLEDISSSKINYVDLVHSFLLYLFFTSIGFVAFLFFSGRTYLSFPYSSERNLNPFFLPSLITIFASLICLFFSFRRTQKTAARRKAAKDILGRLNNTLDLAAAYDYKKRMIFESVTSRKTLD